MGLLDLHGKPLEWNEILPYVKEIKQSGITQFVDHYKRELKRPNDVFKWGDEIEYMIVYFDHENRKVKVSLRSHEVCAGLQKKEKNGDTNLISLWRDEYGRYMLESCPGVPYSDAMSQYNSVETNMKMRREEGQLLLQPNEQLMTLSVFPRLGCTQFTHPSYDIASSEDNPVTNSIFFPDQAVSKHPRFQSFATNVRQRKGRKPVVNIPIFKDKNTPSPFIERFDDPESNTAAKPDHIYMDCLSFAIGNCGLQTTVQGRDFEEAKVLYDQLTPLCPIMLALSAASPIFRGYLSDNDTRWQAFVEGADDRTADEGRSDFNCSSSIRQSRCGFVRSYLTKDSNVFNDVDLEINMDAKSKLLEAGVDKMLAQHIAHIWIRDPIALPTEEIKITDEITTKHFENINSSVWQSLRFKPPVPHSSLGWRVEFRVLEVQLTDFENAAYSVFVILLTRAILSYKLDFRLPMSCVDENAKRAQKNDALNSNKFYFRQNIMKESTNNASPKPDIFLSGTVRSNEKERNWNKALHEEMSIHTIMNGKSGGFPGLISLVRQYVSSMEVNPQTRLTIDTYLNLISKRASGDYMTTAQWIRQFVRVHPEYKHDSVVTESIAYDLLVKCNQIEKGELDHHELFDLSKHKNEYVFPSKDDMN